MAVPGDVQLTLDVRVRPYPEPEEQAYEIVFSTHVKNTSDFSIRASTVVWLWRDEALIKKLPYSEGVLVPGQVGQKPPYQAGPYTFVVSESGVYSVVAQLIEYPSGALLKEAVKSNVLTIPQREVPVEPKPSGGFPFWILALGAAALALLVLFGKRKKL